MDAYLKKEQNGTLFVWVGAPEGGGGGGVQPKKLDPPSTSYFFTPSWCSIQKAQISSSSHHALCLKHINLGTKWRKLITIPASFYRPSPVWLIKLDHDSNMVAF